jgi:hypothetical protein
LRSEYDQSMTNAIQLHPTTATISFVTKCVFRAPIARYVVDNNGGRGRDRTYDQSIKSRKMWVLQGAARHCIGWQ